MGTFPKRSAFSQIGEHWIQKYFHFLWRCLSTTWALRRLSLLIFRCVFAASQAHLPSFCLSAWGQRRGSLYRDGPAIGHLDTSFLGFPPSSSKFYDDPHVTSYYFINFILLSPCIFTNSLYFTPTNVHVKPLYCSFCCKMYPYTCFDPRIIVRVFFKKPLSLQLHILKGPIALVSWYLF